MAPIRTLTKPTIQIGTQGVHDTVPDDSARLLSRKGKSKAQVSEVLRDFISQFLANGYHAKYMAQSHSGVEFQKLNPTVRIYAQQNKREIPLIEIKVSDMDSEDVAIAPGYELDAKTGARINRDSGNMPVTLSFYGRSETEVDLLIWAVSEILSYHLFRLYRGVIYNREGNWQVCVPRQLTFQASTPEPQPNAGNDDIQEQMSALSFGLFYDAAFVERKRQTHAKVIPGDAPLTIQMASVSNKIYIGEKVDFLIKSDRPVKGFHLADSNIGRLATNVTRSKIVLVALQKGKTKLVVTNERETTEYEFEVLGI